MGGRAVYEKGRRRREEILTVALEVFADEGYRGTSLRTVASRCGLTVAGVLHYFDSREDLLTQVIVRRDMTNSPSSEPSDGSRQSGEPSGADRSPREHPAESLMLVDVARGNSRRPGLVELFVSLTAAARDRDHPAHDLLAGRYADLRSRLSREIAERQESGELPAHLVPDDVARLIIAVTDGAQLQWMVDDEATLDGPLATLLFEILGLPRGG